LSVTRRREPQADMLSADELFGRQQKRSI